MYGVKPKEKRQTPSFEPTRLPDFLSNDTRIVIGNFRNSVHTPEYRNVQLFFLKFGIRIIQLF